MKNTINWASSKWTSQLKYIIQIHTEFSKVGTQMTEKHLKKCSTSLVIREYKSKLHWYLFLYQSECLNLKNKWQLMMVRMWSKQYTHPLPVGEQTSPATMEINVKLPLEGGDWSTSRSSYIILGHTPKWCFILLQVNLFNHVDCFSSHNSEN